MNKDEALKSIKNGVIAALVSAGFTFIVIAIAITTDSSGELAMFNDPFNFFDFGLIIVCAFGIYKKSRVAAVTLLVYFIAAKLMIAFDSGKFSGIGVSLIFIYFYSKAIQGTFAYHKIEKAENPNYKPSSKLWLIIGIPLALVSIGLIVIGVMSTTGLIPSTRVLSESEIPSSTVDKLIEQKIIANTDQVLYFYAQGLTLEESGNVLTQDEVILYYQNDEEEMEIYALNLNEVTSIVLEEEGTGFNDSIYKISADDPEMWLNLYLSTEQKGDEKFVEELRARSAIK